MKTKAEKRLWNLVAIRHLYSLNCREAVELAREPFEKAFDKFILDSGLGFLNWVCGRSNIEQFTELMNDHMPGPVEQARSMVSDEAVVQGWRDKRNLREWLAGAFGHCWGHRSAVNELLSTFSRQYPLTVLWWLCVVDNGETLLGTSSYGLASWNRAFKLTKQFQAPKDIGYVTKVMNQVLYGTEEG